MKVVYLAGGMRSKWQDVVKKAHLDAIYLDPRDHGPMPEKAYTDWDVTAIRRADIVFAYLEKDNPGGQGLALEIGVASALGKYVIFVEEPGHPQTRYFGMCRQVADVTVETLDLGIKMLDASAHLGVR